MSVECVRVQIRREHAFEPFQQHGSSEAVAAYHHPPHAYTVLRRGRLFVRGVRPYISVPDFDVADLATDGFWKIIDEFDDPRIFIGRRQGFHVILSFLNQCVGRGISAGQDDRGLDDQAADRVWNGWFILFS
jgi:hypothetical protein